MLISIFVKDDLLESIEVLLQYYYHYGIELLLAVTVVVKHPMATGRFVIIVLVFSVQHTYVPAVNRTGITHAIGYDGRD